MLSFHYKAKDVYLVLTGSGKVMVKTSDTLAPGSDVKDGVLTVDGDRMYHIIHENAVTDNTLTLEFPPGIEAYAFIFG